MKTTIMGVAGTLALAAAAFAEPSVHQGAGANPAAIQGAVDAFRAAIGLGGGNNGNAGAFTTGRREINWDGGANTDVTVPLAGNAFNVGVRRGCDMTTPGTGFVLSARDPANAANPNLRFADVNAALAQEFQVFSAQRLFASLGDTTTLVNFFTPADPTVPATVNGFGVVFVDVDRPDSTRVEFLNEAGDVLLTRYAPAAPGGLSFLGVRFEPGVRIRSVRIHSGTAPLAAGAVESSTADVVVMDDFIYSEPLPPICKADFDNGNSGGEPDLSVTIDDLIFYLGLFAAGDARADIDDGYGNGVPDYGVNIDDLLYYLERFEAGC